MLLIHLSVGGLEVGKPDDDVLEVCGAHEARAHGEVRVIGFEEHFHASFFLLRHLCALEALIGGMLERKEPEVVGTGLSVVLVVRQRVDQLLPALHGTGDDTTARIVVRDGTHTFSIDGLAVLEGHTAESIEDDTCQATIEVHRAYTGAIVWADPILGLFGSHRAGTSSWHAIEALDGPVLVVRSELFDGGIAYDDHTIDGRFQFTLAGAAHLVDDA